MSVPKQGGVLNYLGKQEVVNAPKHWKSSPDSPKTELVYITDAEKGLLMDANLHGSLLDKPNIGPSNLLSFDGWGSTDASQNRPGSSISAGMDKDSGHQDWGGESAAQHGETAATQSSGHTEAHLEKATAKNIVDLVDQGVNINDAISGKTSLERILQSKSPMLSANVLSEILAPFANAANTKRRSNWLEGTDKYGFPRSKDFYRMHGRAYNPNAVLVKGSPEYEFLEDSGYFKSLGGDNNTGGGDNTAYDVPEDVKFIEDPGANRPDSVAARWYANLGKTSNNTLSFQSQYNAAKAKQASILGTPSPMRWLAISQSPYYNFLKENKLDRGIL